MICGNFVPEGWGEDGSSQEKASLYAAGCEVAHVRQIAARGARGKWAGFILDIKTAFLNSLLLDPFKPRTAPAPTLTDNPTELIAVRPPKVLVAHGLADKNEFYLCLRAVYGLPQSPRDWGITRDQTITDMRISVSLSDFSEVEQSTLDPTIQAAIGKELVRQPSAADSQVWSLRLPHVGKDGEPGPALAWVAVYVDDLFVMGPRAPTLAIVNKVKNTWETGSVQEIPDVSQGTATFFGIEFAWKGDQLLLGQQGYIRDLQTRYPHIRMQSVPLPPGNIDIPELSPEERDPSALKACQGMLGEVLWIAMRTRPDVMFGVSKLASSMSRNPTGTVPYVEHLLGYVFSTVETVLAYSASDRTEELSSGVAPQALHHLIVHTDASFAPAAGRSHECAIVYQDGSLVSWLSSKQPFTAQSTAEAELLSTMTGYQLGRAHQYLASELFGCDVRLTVLNDNKAALQIIVVDNASWRTRHLRIRAAALKEEFQADHVGIGYVPGVSNGADLGTKAVPMSRLRELVAILGLSSLTSNAPAPGTVSSVRVHTSALASLTLLLCVNAVEGSTHALHEDSTQEWELWALLGMVAVCSIVLWEGAKWMSRKLAQGFRVLSSLGLFQRSSDEPEAEEEVLSEAQPDDEDDLTEVVDPPPRPPSPAPEPPQLRQRPVGQRVYREEPELEPQRPQRPAMRYQYADDVVEVPLPEELHVAPPPSPGPGVDGLPRGFTYDDLFDGPPPGEGGPAPAVRVLDYEQLRNRAIALNNPQMHQALPDPPVNPNPQWPAPVQLPLSELALRASTWGGLESGIHQLPPAGIRDFYLYSPSRPFVLVRWHAAPRVQLFSPRGSRLPGHLAVNMLVGSRRTFMWYHDGTTEIIDDNWLRRGQRPSDRSWRGRTEFLVEWAATQPRGRA